MDIFHGIRFQGLIVGHTKSSLNQVACKSMTCRSRYSSVNIGTCRVELSYTILLTQLEFYTSADWDHLWTFLMGSLFKTSKSSIHRAVWNKWHANPWPTAHDIAAWIKGPKLDPTLIQTICLPQPFWIRKLFKIKRNQGDILGWPTLLLSIVFSI